MAAPMACPNVKLFLRFSNLSMSFMKKTWVAPHLYKSTRLYTSIREVKKFYKNATIATSDGWYEINLDKRKLRTPAGGLFRVPNEALALAVATEWNGQDKTVKRHGMHLTTLCNTALDNPLRKTREVLTEDIVSFLETDTICYRMEEPTELHDLQIAHWEPILQWARHRYQIQIESTYDIAPPHITEESKDIIIRHLMSYSDWALLEVFTNAKMIMFMSDEGYHYAVDSIKSVILAMAVMDRHIDVERAVHLASLEQIFQSQRWGNVEWHHDVAMYDVQSRLAAAALFVHWCSENTSIRQKASLEMQSQ